MTKKTTLRTCIDCGKDISNLYHNAVRCKECSKKRKQQQDSLRLKKKRSEKLRWHFFIEDPETREITHRSAKGSKLRYWLDKICKQLTIQDLEFLLTLWDWRVGDRGLTSTQRHEYRTCAGIVRDWRDYYTINQTFKDISFDAATGIIFNTDGTYLTVDFDEEREAYIVRNSEGTIICSH
jgi:DNA-directed RNA polymerase subunit RPC12/RpoP